MLDEFESRLNAPLKMAAMSDARHLLTHKGECLGPKLAQLISMQS